jgi:hypothetical protein
MIYSRNNKKKTTWAILYDIKIVVNHSYVKKRQRIKESFSGFRKLTKGITRKTVEKELFI